MRLPNTAHTARPWRIHELVGDFVLEDVWALPTPGGPDEFGRFVEIYSDDSRSKGSVIADALFAIRWKLGALFGLDKTDGGLDSRVASLRDRVPEDLRTGPRGPDFGVFTSLYLTDDEWAAELANRTCHAVMHMGWVSDGAGGHHAEMAVLVKPNGLFGKAYMAGIKPFRYWLVYPPIMRSLAKDWQRRNVGRTAG
ncbi:DUF2867 domain-containing protein [Streptomyces sp. NPDC026206]|uniref:DUF2867 domain-containing protein n=1 Tax=Streptomyces sp. NPDC026206 TaxID=3157089 RepID=UPI0033CEEC43